MANATNHNGGIQIDGVPLVFGVRGEVGKGPLSYFHIGIPKRAMLGLLLPIVEQLRIEAITEHFVEARLVEEPKIKPVGGGVVGPDGMRLV